MNIGEHIKKARKNAGLTQTQLAEMIGKGFSTVQKYELGLATPPVNVLQKIAILLDVSILELLDQAEPVNYFWSANLEDKLKQVGCGVGHDEENAMLWIKYPDGTLEVTDDDLQELHISSNEYMRFKLEELKRKRMQDFRPKRS